MGSGRKEPRCAAGDEGGGGEDERGKENLVMRSRSPRYLPPLVVYPSNTHTTSGFDESLSQTIQ